MSADRLGDQLGRHEALARRGRLDAGDVGADGAQVLEGETGRDLAQLLKRLLVGRLARLDDQVAHAEVLDERHHLLLRAGANRQHRDHGGDAEDHAEHGQQRAQLVDEQVVDPELERRQDVGGPRAAGAAAIDSGVVSADRCVHGCASGSNAALHGTACAARRLPRAQHARGRGRPMPLAAPLAFSVGSASATASPRRAVDDHGARGARHDLHLLRLEAVARLSDTPSSCRCDRRAPGAGRRARSSAARPAMVTCAVKPGPQRRRHVLQRERDVELARRALRRPNMRRRLMPPTVVTAP